MKEGKQECAKPPKPPQPNLKNKVFVKWAKAESCEREDNILSSEWREKLHKVSRFIPVYDNEAANMTYIMSGEYGRMWQKERDKWYAGAFVLNADEIAWANRMKKIKRQIKVAKKNAQVAIEERRIRRAKELEIKAKVEAENHEKQRAKVQQFKETLKSKPKKKGVGTLARSGSKVGPGITDDKGNDLSGTANNDNSKQKNECANGWTPVEVTIQCECSHHDATEQESKKKEENKEKEPEIKKNQSPETKANCDGNEGLCLGYCKQLQETDNKKEE